MAHEITKKDDVILRDKEAWHGLGTIIENDISAVTAARRVLGWSVDGQSLVAESDYAKRLLCQVGEALGSGDVEAARASFAQYNREKMNVDTHVANIRVDGDGAQSLLGVVSDDYKTCQNHDLAKFVDSLGETGEVTIETCGSIRGGKKLWFLARGESIRLEDRDELKTYMLIANGHDGSTGIQIIPTTVRVVCSNTLHMVIPREGELTTKQQLEKAAITIQHTGDLSAKMEQARLAITQFGEYRKRNMEIYQQLVDKDVSEEEAIRMFNEFYELQGWMTATKNESNATSEKRKKLAEARYERRKRATDDFLARYHKEREELGLRQSAWLAMNAITGYIQHDRGKDVKDMTEKQLHQRLDSNLFGTTSRRTIQSLNIAIAS